MGTTRCKNADETWIMTTGLGFAERKEKYPIDKSGKKPGTYYKIFKIERTELVILRLWQQNGTALSLLIPSIFYIDYTVNLILTLPIKY